MHIGILTLVSESLTYTMAKALTFCGHQVEVWVADVERDRSSPWSLSKAISRIPRASVVGHADAQPDASFDRLIVQGHPLLPSYTVLFKRLATHAQYITLVTAGDRNHPQRRAIKLQWSELRRYGRWLNKIDRVAYKNGYHSWDLLRFLRRRQMIGFDPHSMFLEDPALYQALHAMDWEPLQLRRYRVNFIGCRDPQRRGIILDTVEPYFRSGFDAPSLQFWHVFTDAEPAPLSQSEFLRILTESDFTLAPLGYALVTHRPLEALLRGSIPVLNADELDLYEIGLVDGINCIAAEPGDWSRAMERIMHMGQEEIVAMRKNIQTMLNAKVVYPALARDISRRLGAPVCQVAPD